LDAGWQPYWPLTCRVYAAYGFDEVGTARTLREHRAVTDALVAKHGGRIVKATADGLLLEFPSVVDAVECAVAVQAVMVERNQGVPQDQHMLLSRSASPPEIRPACGRSIAA
jgi:class 3 adenylate cyclase